MRNGALCGWGGCIYLSKGSRSWALCLWEYILFLSNSFQGEWREGGNRRAAESWTGVIWEEDQTARGTEWAYHQGKGRYPLKKVWKGSLSEIKSELWRNNCSNLWQRINLHVLPFKSNQRDDLSACDAGSFELKTAIQLFLWCCFAMKQIFVN